MSEEMVDVVKRYIENELLRDRDDGGIESDENLFTGGLIDSMGIMRLVAFLEKSYDIKIPPADLTPANFMTVEKIAGYLKRLIA